MSNHQNNVIYQRLKSILPGWQEWLISAENCTRNAIRWRIECGSLLTPHTVAVLLQAIDARIADLNTLKTDLAGAAHVAEARRLADPKVRLAGRVPLSEASLAKWIEAGDGNEAWWRDELAHLGYTFDGFVWSKPEGFKPTGPGPHSQLPADWNKPRNV